MAYTGAWRSSQKTTPPADANPNLGNAVDHVQHTEADQYLDPFPEPTPQLPAMPTYLYAADDWLNWPEPLVHDPVLTEPLGHDYGEVQGGDSATQLGSIAEAYEAHMADYGGAAVHHANDPIERAERDTYVTSRVEMEFPSTGSRAALTRGRNAWPENNPEGPPHRVPSRCAGLTGSLPDAGSAPTSSRYGPTRPPTRGRCRPRGSTTATPTPARTRASPTRGSSN
jgi:hypothetical protein